MENENEFRQTILRLGGLLIRHPFYKSEVERLRTGYGIAPTDKAGMLEWQHNDRERYHKLVSEVESLLGSFDIARELRSPMYFFTYDYLFLRDSKHIPFQKLGLVTSVDSRDKYAIAFTEHTKLEDVKKLWEQARGDKKARNYGVPKLSEQLEKVWDLHSEGVKAVEIADKLNDESEGTTSYVYSDVSQMIYQYNKALNSLKSFKH